VLRLIGAVLDRFDVPAPVRSILPDPTLPLTRLPETTWWAAILNHPPVRALVPVPLMLALAPAIWWVFRKTWREVDEEAARDRALAPQVMDYRPAVCFVMLAVILTIQEYYGGRALYDQVIRPSLEGLEVRGARWVKLGLYDELYGYAWWSFSRIAGYVLIPLPVWKLLFPNDSLLDMGLRVRGFFSHLWIYGLCLAFVLPAMLVVAREPDFGNYYPFYKLSSRSWFDFLAWEAMYFLQFFALELFFRGWVLGALRRSLGAAAIFAMAVPYCMIHYGKPYLEAHGAIVAGIVLGSLAMRTRSIYAGFLVHITVAFLMDFLALSRRGALPTILFPS
jgi:membrane protease YdiL (CAAX protease family)